MAADSSSKILVLLEKESDLPQFAGDTVDGQLPLTLLRDVSVFDGFTTEEIFQVVPQSEVVVYQQGDMNFEQGGPAEEMFVVLEGEVQGRIPNLPSEETEITQLGYRGVFGESMFFCPGPHTMKAECVSLSVALLSSERVALDEFLQAAHPAA